MSLLDSRWNVNVQLTCTYVWGCGQYHSSHAPHPHWHSGYSSLVPRPRFPHGERVWHTSSRFLVLLTRQFRILDYQSDSRHVIFHVTLASAIAILTAIISVFREHTRMFHANCSAAGTLAECVVMGINYCHMAC